MKRTILLAIVAMNLALATPPHTPRPVILHTNVAHRSQTFQDWMFQLKLALHWL
jgi:hypothetical protein